MTIQYRMIGTCPECGRQISRPAECSHAACDCSNPPNVIELSPVIILSGRSLRKFNHIADQAGVSLEHLVNAVLEVGIKKIEKMDVKEVLKLG